MQAENVYEHVGRSLRELRRERGLTQADAAKVIEVSPQQYQKYEDAQSKCSLTNLMLLADFFEVPLGAVLPIEPTERAPAEEKAETATEADLLARLVGAFVKLNDVAEKLRLVQLVEAINMAQEKSGK